MPQPGCDVSIILPFGDDEDQIGAQTREIANTVRSLGLSFELLAVDEDSGDNSHAVLALMRAEVPELRVLHAPGVGRGVDTGSARAVGATLVIVDSHATVSAQAIADAVTKVRERKCDAHVELGRFSVVERIPAAVALRGLKAVGANLHKRLLRRLQLARLNVAVVGGAGSERGFRMFARAGFSRW